ncbi:O-methyltransferase [Hymenopellis radicata]|nr:O-methyltransferase [Hymenopellis radicata]
MTSSLPILRTLADLISSGVRDIEDTCARKNLRFPGLDGTFEGTQDMEAAKDVPEIAQAICTIVAAASHLTALVQPVQTSMMAAIMQYNISAALFTAEALSVTEILRDVGNAGMNVVDIASRAGTSPKKLAHVLRLLATEHIYKEVAPDVFANNRISSLLDSGKPLSEVLDPSKDKYTAPCSPMPVMVQGMCETAKFTTYLPQYMSIPAFAFADDQNKTLFNMVNKTELSFFEYLGLPENAHIRQRFGIAMGNQGTPLMDGFDWPSLPDNAVVVDVGGGVGRASLSIARTCPKLSIKVQDLPVLENDVQNFWKDEFPEVLQTGRVEFQAQDFFEVQRVQSADVYLLRSVLHDWSDVHCARILKRLREAACPRSKLVIIDAVLSYAVQCNDGVLLANHGHANLTGHAYSVHMMSMFNGQERTLPEFERLFAESGWRLESVKRPDMSYQSFIVAIPSGVPAN